MASYDGEYIIGYKEAFYDETEQCLGIVMEFADKGDLYQKICEFKKAGVYFEESDIFRIFIQIYFSFPLHLYTRICPFPFEFVWPEQSNGPS